MTIQEITVVLVFGIVFCFCVAAIWISESEKDE